MKAKRAAVATKVQTAEVDLALAAPGPDRIEWDEKNEAWKCWHADDSGGRYMLSLKPSTSEDEVRRSAKRIEAYDALLKPVYEKALSRKMYEKTCGRLGVHCYADAELGRRRELQHIPDFVLFYGTEDDFKRGIAIELAARRHSHIEQTATLERRRLEAKAAPDSGEETPCDYLVHQKPITDAPAREEIERDFDALLGRLPTDEMRVMLKEMVDQELTSLMPRVRQRFGLRAEGRNPEHDRAAQHVRTDYLAVVKMKWLHRLGPVAPTRPRQLVDAYLTQDDFWSAAMSVITQL